MQRENHKRNHTVYHAEKNGPVRVHHGDGLLDDSGFHEQGVDDAAVSENVAPAVQAQQRTDPEGENDQQHQDPAEPFRNPAQKPGEGIGDQQTDDTGFKGHQQRFPRDLQVQRGEDALVACKGELVLYAAVKPPGAEAHHDDIDQRHGEKQKQPEGRRAYHHQDAQKVRIERSLLHASILRFTSRAPRIRWRHIRSLLWYA